MTRARSRSSQQIANRVTRSFSMRKVKVREAVRTDLPPGTWTARYSPRARTAYLNFGPRTPMAIKRAALGHELGHAVADEHFCRQPRRRRRGFLGRRRCRYHGEHDRVMMYPVTQRVHRIVGTRPAAARIFERQSGYQPPRGFMRRRRRRRVRR